MEENKEFDVYNEKARNELVESDEIDDTEEGFMKGYEDDANPTQCSNCGKILSDSKFVEETIGGENYRFCSENCASRFELKKEHV